MFLYKFIPYKHLSYRRHMLNKNFRILTLSQNKSRRIVFICSYSKISTSTVNEEVKDKSTNDIFGIESSNDVLHFKSDSPPNYNKYEHFFGAKRKEIFKSAPYGLIRRDRDNVTYSSENTGPNTGLFHRKGGKLYYKENNNKTKVDKYALKGTWPSTVVSQDTVITEGVKNYTHINTSQSADTINKGDKSTKYDMQHDFIDHESNSIVPTSCVKSCEISDHSCSYIDDLYFDNRVTDASEDDDKNSGNSKYAQSQELKLVGDVFNDVRCISDNAMSEIDQQYFGDKLLDKKEVKPEFSSTSNDLVDFDQLNIDHVAITNKKVEETNLSGLKRPHNKQLQNVTKIDISKVELSELKKNESKRTATAYDSVVKMKKATYISSLIQDDNIAAATGKMFDSKGFRILKNQVPDFSLLTNAEIVQILKNRVLYSNDDVVVLNKPYSLVIHESKTTKVPCLSMLLDDLARSLDPKSDNPKLLTVHRLDKETTGCLLLARNELTANYIQSLFAQRKISKTYWILTSGVPEHLEGTVEIPIAEGYVNSKNRMVLAPEIPDDIGYRSHSKHGRRAVTHYKVMSTSGNAAFIEVSPETGLKHQIRVHFGLGLGCPIIGDHKYSYLDKMAPQKLPSDLLQRLNVRQSKVRHIPMHIHARSIVIPQFLNGRNLFAIAPLPDHMKRNLKSLKFKKK